MSEGELRLGYGSSLGHSSSLGMSLGDSMGSVEVAMILERYSDRLVDLVSAKVAQRLDPVGANKRSADGSEGPG